MVSSCDRSQPRLANMSDVRNVSRCGAPLHDIMRTCARPRVTREAAQGRGNKQLTFLCLSQNCYGCICLFIHVST